MLIEPTLDIAEAYSKDRFAPMIRDTQVLSALIHEPRTRDGAGCRRLGGARSTAKARIPNPGRAATARLRRGHSTRVAIRPTRSIAFAIQRSGGTSTRSKAPTARVRSGRAARARAKDTREVSSGSSAWTRPRTPSTAHSGLQTPGPGYAHFPASYELEFFQQLTAEQVRTKFHNGH